MPQADTNLIIVNGHATRDAEVKTTGTGKRVAQIGIATNHWNGKEEVPSFHTVVAWDKLAETATRITKGKRVIVTGRMTYRSYENREGAKVNVAEIVAATLDIAAPEEDAGLPPVKEEDDLLAMPF